MHDIRAIREAPEAFDAALARRGLPPVAAEVLAIDEGRRARILAAEQALAERNAASREVGAAKARGDEAGFERLRALVAEKKDEIARLEAEAAAADAGLRDMLMGIPNLPHDDVPDGPDETANVELRRWGTPRAFDFRPREHFEIGEAMGLMDFETAAKLSGARFVVLRGALARLERALAQFMLDLHTSEFGYTEIVPPYMVRDEVMYGTGQLPKFREDQFLVKTEERIGPEEVKVVLDANGRLQVTFHGPREKELTRAWGPNEEQGLVHLDHPTSQGGVLSGVYPLVETHRWLIPTAEVPLTNLVRESIRDIPDLPIRVTAHTACFRAEAGAAGKDTRGMIRQHQFSKVELVSITTPDQSLAEHERMTACAEEVLKRLGLPYRTVLLCAGDMGFGSRKTYDIEVWLPGQDAYREISSCSVCGDFQARRMNARFRRGEGARPEFVHTLNGSGLAVGRTLIAVLENGQEADGSVTLPEALRPWLAGRSRIDPKGALV